MIDGTPDMTAISSHLQKLRIDPRMWRSHNVLTKSALHTRAIFAQQRGNLPSMKDLPLIFELE
jgi:hypothetical protein